MADKSYPPWDHISVLVDSADDIEGFYRHKHNLLPVKTPATIVAPFKERSVADIYLAMQRGLKKTLKGEDMSNTDVMEEEFRERAEWLDRQVAADMRPDVIPILDDGRSPNAQIVTGRSKFDTISDNDLSAMVTAAKNRRGNPPEPATTLLDQAMKWIHEWLGEKIESRNVARHEDAVRDFVIASMTDEKLTLTARSAILELSAFGAWVESRFGQRHSATDLYHGDYFVSSTDSVTEVIHIRIWMEFKRTTREAYNEGQWNVGSYMYGVGSGIVGLRQRLRNLPPLYGRPKIFNEHTCAPVASDPNESSVM